MLSLARSNEKIDNQITTRYANYLREINLVWTVNILSRIVHLESAMQNLKITIRK